MKNLKKLLIAVAILALLVTGVVISAFASSSENAEFNRAKLFYSYVESERGARAKSEELKLLYEFVETSTLSGKVEGFDEFKADYQAASLKIGYSLYEEAMTVGDTLGKFNALNQVRVHFKACPVDDSIEGYDNLATLISANMEELVRVLYEEAIATDVSADGGAARRNLLLSIFAQAASIPLSDTEWDHYYFMVDYNTSNIEAAMSLAEIAAGMFANAEKDARKQYQSDLIAAIAEMYAAEERDRYIIGASSDVLEARLDAYEKKYAEAIAAGAEEQAAIDAATAAGDAAYQAAITEVKSRADAAYDAAIADGATEEEAKLAYEKIAYADAYKAYDDAYAAGVENLEALADAAYDAAYEAKLTEIYNAAYQSAYEETYNAALEGVDLDAIYDGAYAAKLAEIYDAAYAAKYDEVYAAELEANGGDEEAAKVAAAAAAETAANAAKEDANSVTTATEAANAAKDAKLAELAGAADVVAKAAGDAEKAKEESVAAATEAAEAAKAAKIEEIEAAATAAAEAAFSAKKTPIDQSANSHYDSELEKYNTQFSANLNNAYNEAHDKAYNDALLAIAGPAKNAYDAAYAAAIEGGAGVADAVTVGFEAYWAAVNAEAEAAYAPVYKANYENALAILVTCADEKYKEAYTTAYDEAIALAPTDIDAAVVAGKKAGEKAYKAAVDGFKAALGAAADETAYNKVINDALKAITDAAYENVLATILVDVEYDFTLPARNAYNTKYQETYEVKLEEFLESDKNYSRAEASMMASAAAKAEAELAYQQALKESVAGAVNEISELLGQKVKTAAEAARTAAYNAAIEAEKSEGEANAAGEDAYLAFYVAKLSDYYKATAKTQALARCEEIKAEILERAKKSAEAESAGAYDNALNKYESAAEAAGAAAGEKAYNDAFDKLIADFCELYSITSQDAQKALDEKAVYNDPINDETLKGKYSTAVENFEGFYSKCDIDQSLGSLAVSFERLDTILKEVALTDARFILVEYLKIPNKANGDHPYPLNEKNAVISKVQNAIDVNGLNSSVAGFVDFYNQFSAAKTEFEELLQKAKDDLDRLADLEQYDWTSDAGYYEYKEDFSSGSPLNGLNEEGDTKVILGNENGNFNTTLHYGSVNKHLYVEPSFSGKFENGLVLNFDMKFSEDFHALQFRVISRSGGTFFTDSVNFTLKDGKIALYYHNLDNKNVYVYDIFEPGIWNHFTLTYNHANHTGSLYVNYEHIGDISYYDTANKTEVDFQFLRINAQTTHQEVSLDNLHFFAGSTYRDYYKFQSMSDGDIFKYCVELFTDDSLNAANRNGAYVKAKGLYPSFVGNSSYAEYTKYFTEEYANYYEDYIKKPAIKSNMEKIATMFAEIPERNSANIDSVRVAISNIEKFVANNVDFLDRTSAEYIAQMAQLSVVETEILRAEYVRDFAESLRFFDRATTLAAMTKHYNKARDLYILAGYAKTDNDGNYTNINYVIEDPAVLAFAEEFGEPIDPEAEELEYDPYTLFEYYLETAVEKMAVRENYENSRRIVDCLNFILDMKVEVEDEEGNVTVKEYEDSEEFWLANYDYINTYVTIIRNVVASDSYDKSYTEDGKPISYFIEKYEHINAFFYELLQKEHLEHLLLQFESFAYTDSYIQKVGICNYIKKYVQDNDIDVTRPEFAEIINKVSVYENELESQKKDYASILNQNTQYFITTVNKMTAYVNYEDLIVLFEEATEYYYLMNIDSEEAKAAIEIYSAYGEKLAGIEEYSTLFIGYVREVSLALKYSGERRENALYAGLVNAMSCVDGIDMTYEGVEDAYATYTEQLAAYNNSADAINSDISGIADVTCAVRTNTISKVVLAIIKTIFSN